MHDRCAHKYETYTHLHTHTHANTNIHTEAHRYSYTCDVRHAWWLRSQVWNIHALTHTHTRAHRYSYACACKAIQQQSDYYSATKFFFPVDSCVHAYTPHALSYIHVQKYISTRKHIHTHTWTHTHTHTFMHAHHMHLHVCTYKNTSTHQPTHTHAHEHTHTHMQDATTDGVVCQACVAPLFPAAGDRFRWFFLFFCMNCAICIHVCVYLCVHVWV